MSDRDIPIAVGPWKLTELRSPEGFVGSSNRHIAVYEREIDRRNGISKADCRVEISALLFDMAGAIRAALEDKT